MRGFFSCRSANYLAAAGAAAGAAPSAGLASAAGAAAPSAGLASAAGAAGAALGASALPFIGDMDVEGTITEP